MGTSLEKSMRDGYSTGEICHSQMAMLGLVAFVDMDVGWMPAALIVISDFFARGAFAASPLKKRSGAPRRSGSAPSISGGGIAAISSVAQR
jgi:hypothetical protein